MLAKLDRLVCHYFSPSLARQAVAPVVPRLELLCCKAGEHGGEGGAPNFLTLRRSSSSIRVSPIGQEKRKLVVDAKISVQDDV